MPSRITQTELGHGLFTVVIDPDQLVVTQAEIGRSLGYGEKKMPEHFAGMIGDILEQLEALCSIRAGYRLVDLKAPVDRTDGLYAGNTFFSMKKIVSSQLRKAEKAALFACTIGPGMEEWRRQLMRHSDEVRALLVDAVASAAVEAAAGLLHDHIQMKMREQGQSVTNRFSPGYCGWSVAEQQQLFSLLPDGFCGITLTESSLMVPIKSVSGIIGIGAKVVRKDYPCNQCDRSLCIYRTFKKGPP